MKYILLILLLIPQEVIAKVWVTSSVKALYENIQKASPADTILVMPGRYKVGNIRITRPLTLSGKGFPVLDGQLKGEILTIQASDVYIRGIQLENVGETSSIDWAGIKVLESEHVTIENNRFRNCYFGIYLSACSKITVKNNLIQGKPREEQTTGNGIHAWKSDSILIAGNRVSGHRDGIYFEFVTNSLVSGNHSSENIRYGLHFMFSHKDTYASNTFDRNGAGVAVMYTKFVTMKNNVFRDNWGGAAYGMLLKDITDSRMEDNLFRSNTVGIYMEGCSRSEFLRNKFSENGIAMRIQANCDDNTIRDNNFMANTFDVATNGNTVYNRLSQNYWDRYEGYDLDRDGFGDIPFRPVSLFSVLIERVPQTMMLLRSFTAMLLDKIEKVIPDLIPENLKDDKPRIKPL